MTDTVNSTTLECLRRETADNPTASVIWLHGLGADATDFEPLVPMLDIEASVRFIFPNAPVRPVTINGGMEMRAWYDIDPGAPLAGGADIKNSVAAIRSIIAEEIAAGIPSERIALAGFSQGGVIALELGLSHNQPLAGIMALSTYLHDHEQDHRAYRSGKCRNAYFHGTRLVGPSNPDHPRDYLTGGPNRTKLPR